MIMMKIQKSFDNGIEGTLYIVPTPIGNLEDITYRALNILRQSTIIAAEDTRNTMKLLNHFEIQKKLISYHEHNRSSREKQLLDRLKNGEMIALVSDAGMPAISDPGHELVQTAIQLDISVVVLPGANAALCALVGSGLPTNEFLFHGFLPKKKKDKVDELKRLKNLAATILFYESPYRLKETLNILYEQFGDRRLVVARELTKRFEEYIRGTTTELLDWVSETELRGEFCIVVEGTDQLEEEKNALWWSHLSVNDHVTYYLERKEIPSKEAIKQVAEDRNMPRRTVYQMFHVENKN